MVRATLCTQEIRRGRLRKAEQFFNAASQIADLAKVSDAYVTLCVHAGIAASDVICCARLGQHAAGDNHNEAVSLLRRADDSSAKSLQVLLSLKTKSRLHASPDFGR